MKYLYILPLVVVAILFYFRPILVSESHTFSESSSKKWWLSSGGQIYFFRNKIFPLTGDLHSSDPWYVRYKKNNPKGSNEGKRPQNIFRLVNVPLKKDFTQSVYFKLLYYAAPFPEQPHDGVFLMSRYVDSDNLYYYGLRVDGVVVIKKKYHGKYTTLAYKKVLPDVALNNIPQDKYLGLKISINSNGVKNHLVAYLDLGTGFKKVFDIYDSSKDLSSFGKSGLRSDNMDVVFKDYNYEILD